MTSTRTISPRTTHVFVDACTILILALLAIGCGSAPRSGGPVASGVAPPVCQLAGAWTGGTLRSLAGGYEFAELHDARFEAQLDRTEGPLRLHVALAREGWHLFGRLDPEEDDVLRVRSAQPLSDSVILGPGAPAALLDARVGEGGAGEVLLGISTYARREDGGFRFVTPIQRWLPCDAVGLSFELRDERHGQQERVAIGLPAEPPSRAIAVGARVLLSTRPGAAPFLEIAPREYPEHVLVISEEGDQTRILVHHWDGTMILGWVPSAALTTVEVGSGGFADILSVGALVESLDVCTSPERMTLFASRAGSAVEAIGWLDPGTRFVRGVPVSDDGAFSLRPRPGTGVHVHGDGVLWAARSQSPLVCGREQYDPSADLAAQLEAMTTSPSEHPLQ